MNIEVSIDAAKALLRLRRGANRMGYAAVTAINKTVLAVQAAERERAARVFTLRKSDFILRQVAIVRPFASVAAGRFEARVSVGQKPRLLLGQYETGFTRQPFKGKNVAVPVLGGARPTREAAVPAELRFTALQLRRPVTGRRAPRKAGPGTPLRRGLLRTFMVPGAVLQRVGRGATRVLYVLARPFRVAPRLEFYRTARRVIARDFARNLKRQIDETFGRHA
ncbi:MAG: hypothetical protein AAB290_02945 [Candidatus Eisenbacteria bacterium]|mgnify:CR=1 FL=1